MTPTEQKAAEALAREWREGWASYAIQKLEIHQLEVQDRLEAQLDQWATQTLAEKNLSLESVSRSDWFAWRLEIIDMAGTVTRTLFENLVLIDGKPSSMEFGEELQRIIDNTLNDQFIYYYQYHAAIWCGMTDSRLWSESLDNIEDISGLGAWGHQTCESVSHLGWRGATEALAHEIAGNAIRQELRWSEAEDVLSEAYDKNNEEALAL